MDTRGGMIYAENRIHGTMPPILHFNGKGRNRDDYAWLLANLDKLEKHPQLRDDITVVTPTNHSCPEPLLECCEAIGLPITPIGEDTHPWRNRKKIGIIKEFAESCPTKYMLVLDCADTIIVGDVNIAPDVLEAFECGILFNGEINSWPKLPRIAQYEDTVGKPPFHRLNSGCFIGKTYDIIQVYTDAAGQTWNWKDDQHAMRHMNIGHHCIRVDDGCRVFQSMRIVTKEQVKVHEFPD